MPIFARIDPETEKRFRIKVLEKYGAKRGALETALEDAIKVWLVSMRVDEAPEAVATTYFQLPYAKILDCLKKVKKPSNISRIAKECKVDEEEVKARLWVMMEAKYVLSKNGSWEMNPSKLSEIEDFLRKVKELDELRSHFSILGRLRIPEENSTELMTRLAKWSTSTIVATSYYDVENWGKKPISFWAEYIEAQRHFIYRVKEQIRKRRPRITDEQLSMELKESPAIRRVFIFDSSHIGTQKQWQSVSKILRDHIGIHGYKVRCILKDEAEKIETIPDTPVDRIAKVHDFVMFDKKLVVEIVQSPSEWGENQKNTYGWAYIDPIIGDGPSWTAKFLQYFDQLYKRSLPYEEWTEKIGKTSGFMIKAK